MSESRIVLERACRHGHYDRHMTKPPVFDGPTATTMVEDGEFCREASRQVLFVYDDGESVGEGTEQ